MIICQSPHCQRHVSKGRLDLGFTTCRKSCENALEAWYKSIAYTSPEQLAYMTADDIDGLYTLDKAAAPIESYCRHLWFNGEKLPQQRHGRWLDPEAIPAAAAFTTTT